MSDKSTLSTIPFNIYDFFGYIFPGFLFTSIISYCYIHQQKLNNLQGLTIKLGIKTTDLTDGFLLLLLMIVIFYVVGHVVAAISHIVIDRIFVDGMIGYPYRTILSIPKETNQVTYKIIGVLSYLVLFLPFFESSYKPFTYNNLNSLSWFKVFSCSIFALITIRTFVSIYFKSDQNYYSKITNSFAYKCYAYIGKWIDNLVIDSFKKIIQIDKALPDNVILKIKEKFYTDFGLEYDKVKSDVYWLSFFRLCSNDSYHASLINTWLYLYGFARNMATASFLGIYLIGISIQYAKLELDNSIKTLILTLLFLGTIMIFRYASLYYTYFTKGIFRSYLSQKTP